MTNFSERRRLDPVKTRDTILVAAFDVFADKGFDGASIADIAAVAQVPKSLLQYHFGSKEELWKACLAQKAGPLLQTLDRFLEDGNRGDMAELIALRFRILREHPKIARMLAWASLGSAPIPQFLEERRARLLQLCGPGPSDAAFPRLLLAVAAMDGWFLYRDFYRRAFGETVLEEDMENRLLQLLTGTLLTTGPEASLTDDMTT